MKEFETQTIKALEPADEQALIRDDVLNKLSENPHIKGVSRFTPHVEDSIHIIEDTGDTRVIAINTGQGFMSRSLPEGADLAISVVDWNRQKGASDKARKGTVIIFVSGLNNGPQFVVNENDLEIESGEVLQTIATGIELFESFHRLKGDQRHKFPGNIWDSRPRDNNGYLPEDAPIDPKYLQLKDVIRDESYTIINNAPQPART